MYKTATVLALTFFSLNALSQVPNSADITVSGRVTPGACSLTLGGGGMANFGVLSSGLVKTYQFASDPERYVSPDSEKKTLPLAVSCDSPTKMALSFTDNRVSSVSGFPDTIRWGLGTYVYPGGVEAKIGSYNIHYLTNIFVKATTASAAAVPGGALFTDGAATSSSSWVGPVSHENAYIPAGKSMAFIFSPGTSTPDRMTEIKMDLKIQLELLRTVVDSATTDIILDGSGTVTLVII